MLSAMHRVCFDGNEGPEGHDRYGLRLDRSKLDLARIPGGQNQGMIVTIYMTGEIEMEAVLEWDAKWDGWTARPVEATLRDNHETWEADAPRT
jgi:hypothetical protein